MQPVNGIITSFLLNGSPTATRKYDPNLLLVNEFSNNNRLIDPNLLLANEFSNKNRLMGS
jgi:hypothetical protein